MYIIWPYTFLFFKVFSMSDEKIETCFICGKEFDMNKADLGYYRNGKYPICDFCADFYRFYDEDLTSKKE